MYSVSESAGSIDLNIFFIGNPGAFVPHVFTSTVDGTATGQHNYCPYHNKRNVMN